MSKRKPTTPDKPTLRVVDSGRSGETPAEDGEAFTIRELAFIQAISEGATIREASTTAGIAYTSARRLRRRPDVQAEIRERAREAVGAGTLALGQGAVVAAKTLKAIAAGEASAEGPRVSACRSLLEISLRVLEVDELEQRVAALEAQLDTTAGAPGFAKGTR